MQSAASRAPEHASFEATGRMPSLACMFRVQQTCSCIVTIHPYLAFSFDERSYHEPPKDKLLNASCALLSADHVVKQRGTTVNGGLPGLVANTSMHAQILARCIDWKMTELSCYSWLIYLEAN